MLASALLHSSDYTALRLALDFVYVTSVSVTSLTYH